MDVVESFLGSKAHGVILPLIKIMVHEGWWSPNRSTKMLWKNIGWTMVIYHIVHTLRLRMCRLTFVWCINKAIFPQHYSLTTNSKGKHGEHAPTGPVNRLWARTFSLAPSGPVQLCCEHLSTSQSCIVLWSMSLGFITTISMTSIN